MVKVTVLRTQSVIDEITISGHADAGKYGEDIVCSAVSAVTLGILNSVNILLHMKPDVEIAGKEGGFLRWKLHHPSDEGLHEKQQLLAESIVLSLLAIEQSYGQFIAVSDNKWQGGAHK